MVKVSQYQKSLPQKRWMTNPNYPTIRKISAEFPITKISEWPFQSSTGQHSFQSPQKATLLAWFSDDRKKQVHGRMPWLLRKTHLGTPKMDGV